MKFLAIFVTFLVVFANIRVNAQRKVICYFTNWAVYRSGSASFQPSNIDGSLCTHITYAFALLDDSTLTIKSSSPETDINNQFYQQVTAFRDQGIGVSISLGGWSDSTDKYSRLMADQSARQNFIQNVIQFIEQNNFNGLDLDLEYPGCWQGNCAQNSPDKANYALLVQELSAEFKPRNWLLSAAVSASPGIADSAYDIPVMSQYMDWIGLMTYDYHASWEGKTGFNAPLYSDDGSNSDATVKHWIAGGADPTKLVLGIPSYAQSFTLSDTSNNGLGAPTSGAGNAGQYTGAAGSLAFYEALNNINSDGYNYVRDAGSGDCVYAYQNNQWFSFDDVDTVRVKANYINDNNLGGAMMWALDFDDFNNIAGCGNYPLLTSVNQVLRNTGGTVKDTCFTH